MYLEPVYDQELKDGSYIKGSLGRGVFYVYLVKYRIMGLSLMLNRKMKVRMIFINNGRINY